MSIEFTQEIKKHIIVENYNNALIFLENNNWDLKAIPEEKQKEFLSLANKNNWTVAHEMAVGGYEFTDPEILMWATNKGVTVAYIMAARGYEFTNSEMLKLTDKGGRTVADVCDWKHNTDKFNKILQGAEEENIPGMG